MIRVAFTLISAANWVGTGGYNYLVNLAQALSAHAPDRLQMVFFVGTDAVAANIEPFAVLSGVEVVRVGTFNDARRSQRLRQALLTGCDRAAAQAFREHRIDVLFECAQFYGWRFPFLASRGSPTFNTVISRNCSASAPIGNAISVFARKY